MIYITFFFAILLPISLWLWFIRAEDRSEPEPGRLLRKCFYAAISAAIGAAILEVMLFQLIGLPDDILTADAKDIPLVLSGFAVLLVGPIEELAKYLVLRINVYFSHDFNQVFDGIVYGVTIALGFSFIENFSYFFNLYTTETSGVFVIGTILRGIFSTLGHVTFTGVMGYYIGKAKFSATNRTFLILQGIVYASLMHALFDFLVVGPIPYGGLIAGFITLGVFFLFFRIWNRPDVRMVWKYTPPASLRSRV